MPSHRLFKSIWSYLPLFAVLFSTVASSAALRELPAEEDYKISYSKCNVTIDNDNAITITDTVEKSSIKIVKMKKALVNMAPNPDKYLYAQSLREIPLVTISGAFGKFHSQADILRLEATGPVKAISTKAANIEWIEARSVGSIKNSAQVNAATSTAVCTVMLTDMDKPIKAAFTGIILENFVSAQPIKSLSVASKAYKDMFTRKKFYSLGGIGKRSRVLSQSSGEANVPVEGDSIIMSPEIGSITAKIAPLTPDTIMAGVSKIKVQGGFFKTPALQTVEADMVVRRLISSTPIKSITGVARNVSGNLVGGKIGVPGNPELMRIQTEGDITNIKGQHVSAVFWAGVSGNLPTCADQIKKITVPKGGTIEGMAYVRESSVKLSPHKGEFEIIFTTVILPGGVPLVMTNISAGSYKMGSPDGEQDRSDSEGPQHDVTIDYDFYMGKFEVTKEQWKAIMGTVPWAKRHNYVTHDPKSPAVFVTWNDINGPNGFMDKLNNLLASRDKIPGTFRLPSEAEWQYAARGGTTSRFFWGDDPNYGRLDDYMWWAGNAGNAQEEYAHNVGLKWPNAFGLYDMIGNVWEWSQDSWHSNYTGAPTDGSAWTTGSSSKVLCGGSCFSSGRNCRSATRLYSPPGDGYDDSGFRVVRTQP